ncbi:MAG TPA: hypothetical protein VG650_08695 [Mycobacteriales bacterium]|nr:hypothetical protein [Mycobacteriales bacterium]
MAAEAAPAGVPADAGTARLGPAYSRLLTYPVMTAGALADCIAFAMSRSGDAGAAPLYWLGQIALLLPCIVICLRRSASPKSRIWALQLLAALQSFVAWAYSPDRFRFPDELQHLRTADNILATGHLFSANPALPVSPGFPSLEIVTTAVSRLSGMSVYTAGVITSSVAHVLLVTAVVSWAHALRLGSRQAAAAALVFGFAPDYPYFDTLFTYTAIALPFFVLAARAAVRSVTRQDAALLVLPPLLIAVVSHHLTGYLACGYVALLAATLAMGRRPEPSAPWWTAPGVALVGVAGVGVVCAAAWTAAFAPHALDYLLTPTKAALHAVFSPSGSAAGDVAAHGEVAPLWQRALAIAGSVVMLGLAAVGTVRLWRSPVPRWVQLLAGGAIAYPAVLVIRVVAADGPEIASRLLVYAMLLTCLPVAALLVAVWADGTSRGRVVIALTLAVTIAAGSTVAATPSPWERLPGSFHVAAEESGVDARVAAAAHYGDRTFAPGSVVACDLSLCSLLGGESKAITSSASAPMFFAPTDILRNGEISRLGLDYVLVDDRLTQQLPAFGLYFPGENNTGGYPRPFPPARLASFATDPLYSRVYDNGDIQIYDVSAVWNV